ncbi:MAG: dTMP kinase [Oscillospiraceae bacterium]|nr:dTMP kinase [Oscillospiraceae bacterium]
MFITIDGPDGAGKTTAAQKLASSLSEKNEIFYTSQPSNSKYGAEIRRLLANTPSPDPRKMTGLFIADRAEHIKSEIKPRLDRGIWVVCDRYKYSTIVYQQIQGISKQSLIEGNQGFLIPDVVFILTVSRVEQLLNRIQSREKSLELFETREIMEKTLMLYAQMPECFPDENIHMIDAGGSADISVKQMLAKLNT